MSHYVTQWAGLGSPVSTQFSQIFFDEELIVHWQKKRPFPSKISHASAFDRIDLKQHWTNNIFDWTCLTLTHKILCPSQSTYLVPDSEELWRSGPPGVGPGSLHPTVGSQGISCVNSSQPAWKYQV